MGRLRLPDRRQRRLDTPARPFREGRIGQLLAADTPGAEGVAQHLRELILRARRIGQVEDCAERRGDLEAAARDDFLRRQAGDVEHAGVGGGLAEAGRDGQVDLCWHYVPEAIQISGGVVGDRHLGLAAAVAAPQGPADQILVLARGEVPQAEDAAVDRLPGADPALVDLLRVAVAALRRLGRREVPPLLLGDGVQIVVQRMATLAHRKVLS
ncbi:MAG: hypothetical protein M3Q65_20015 [Chloroflexota bacterium]|nr:hypothetical protein [Chloroflexota bacterium]